MKLIKQHNYNIKSTTYDKTHEKPQNFGIFRLTAKTKYNYIKPALAKSKAGRRKLNLQMANNSTPNRAFFIRSVRAPLPNSLSFDRLFPMVARNGQPLAVDCSPFVAVFLPRYVLPPVVGKLAVVPKNLQMETTQMYQFIFALMRTPTRALKIRVTADNEHQARARFNHGNALLFVGRINLHRQNTRQNHRTFAEKGGE